MKTSNVLASALFGSLAAAAPLQNKREYVTKTELVVQTVVVYTTIWDGETAEAAAATSSGALFYEQPSSQPAAQTSQAPVAVSSAAPVVSSAPAVQAPSSVYTPAASSSAPAPSSVYTPPVVVSSAAPVVSSAAPVVSSAAPVVSSQAPAPVSSAAPATTSAAASSGSGETYTGDATVYDTNGGNGACGTALSDSDFIVALAEDMWGTSTYDKMTGEATNPWCGQSITIEYGGKTVEAKIMDLCPKPTGVAGQGCSGASIDLSRAAWATFSDETTRIHDVKWWKNE